MIFNTHSLPVAEHENTKPSRDTPDASSRNIISVAVSKEELDLINSNVALLLKANGSMTKSEFLRTAATSPDVIEARLRKARDQGLPDTLMWAQDDAAALRGRNPAEEPMAGADRPYMVLKYSYSDIDDGLPNVQKAIAETAVSLKGLGNQKLVPEETGSEFDVIHRVGLFHSARVLLTFPFVLTPLRRPLWGVVPYGKHRRIGVAFADREHSLLQQWHTMPITERRNTPAGGGMPNGIAKWMGSLVDHCLAHQKETGQSPAYAMDGYIYVEILQLMLAKRWQADANWTYEQFVTPFGLKDFNTVLKPVPHGGIFFFDLASKNRMIEALGENCATIQLPHGIDICVGIGFTLSLLPELLQESNWATLLNAAKRYLHQGRYFEEFSEIGIDIDDE